MRSARGVGVCVPLFISRDSGRPGAGILLAWALVSLAFAPVHAAPVNPQPSLQPCPGGGFRQVWKYPFEAGLPDNAVRVDCASGSTCYVFPESACLYTHEVSTALSAVRLTAVGPGPQAPTWRAALPAARRPPAEQPASEGGDGAAEPVAPPDSDCAPGRGWDFETRDVARERALRGDAASGQGLPYLGSLQGWQGQGYPFAGLTNTDQDFVPAPVYGNAAPIERILPPGWSPAIAAEIGGDYWRYSQSVNRRGAFWLSSHYRRYSWGQHPGDAWGGSATGTLSSPACRLRARYLSFRLSGKPSLSQRVELQARGAARADYAGLRFPGGPGDALLGRHPRGRATQGVTEPVLPPALYAPQDGGGWTTVRTVTAVASAHPDWMQVYVFDLKPFRDREVRIRLVDDAAPATPADDYYLNADAFLFEDRPPAGLQWWAWAQERDQRPCVQPGPARCGPVGHVPSTPPLWGITDVHAHPMANLAFGGHVVWGDPTDTLAQVYDCSLALAAIPGPGGRAAVEGAKASSCYVAGDVSLIVTGALLGGCSQLTWVPFVGAGIAVVCKVAVTAAQATLLGEALVHGLTLHGGSKFSGGAFALGSVLWQSIADVLAGSDSPYLGSFSPGLIASTDAWDSTYPQAIGSDPLHWYPRPRAPDEGPAKWHSLSGLGKTHNRYQVQWIRRAHAGGLRLAVWDVVNSRAFAAITDNRFDASDWQALKDQTDAAKRIVDSPELGGIARIAYTPEQAEQIMRHGLLAIVLGSEVDELGRLRPDGLPWPRSPRTTGDSMQKQVDDLWELGIRKVSPVHAVNNPIGGAAIFDRNYVANNWFLNGTPLDTDAAPQFVDELLVRFHLDRSLLGQILRIVLGEAQIKQRIGGDAKTPWNPQGWFEFATGPGDTAVGEVERITYRVGENGPVHRTLLDPAGAWYPPQQVLGDQVLIAARLNNLSTFVRPTPRCDVHGTVWPDFADSFGPVVDLQYVSVAGHRNRLGLYRGDGENGETFLRAAMKKGLLIDVDHLSQALRVDLLALADTYAREAGWDHLARCTDIGCGDYPLMGVHTSVRQLEKEGSSLSHLVGDFGSNSEATRTVREIAAVAANGGLVGVFPRPVLIPPNTAGGQCRKDSDCSAWTGTGAPVCSAGRCPADPPGLPAPLVARDDVLPAGIENDCDGSTKTFAVKYLALLQTTAGRGLTFSSDANGLNGTPFPRYGQSVPGKPACGAGGRADTLGADLDPSESGQRGWAQVMGEWQHVEHSGIWYQDYAARLPLVSPYAALWNDPAQQDPDTTKRWKEVVARDWTERREDGAPRYERHADGSPLRSRVYYNDQGRIPQQRSWTEQDGNVPGAQLAALQRWNDSAAGWDYNLDGFQHIGLLPDLSQDLRNVGVQWEQLQPLFNGAGDVVASWRRATALGAAHP